MEERRARNEKRVSIQDNISNSKFRTDILISNSKSNGIDTYDTSLGDEPVAVRTNYQLDRTVKRGTRKAAQFSFEGHGPPKLL